MSPAIKSPRANQCLPVDFRNIHAEIAEAQASLVGIRKDVETIKPSELTFAVIKRLQQTAVDLCSRNEATLQQLSTLAEYMDEPSKGIKE